MNFKKYKFTTLYEALGIIVLLVLVASFIVGLFVGITYYWNLAIAWALNTIFGTDLPYDWTTVGGLFVIQLVINLTIQNFKNLTK